MCSGGLAYKSLNRSIVVAIQRHIVKRSKRNAISRRFQGKDDDEAINTWKSDLEKIRHIFNVRSLFATRVYIDCQSSASRPNLQQTLIQTYLLFRATSLTPTPLFVVLTSAFHASSFLRLNVMPWTTSQPFPMM